MVESDSGGVLVEEANAAQRALEESRFREIFQRVHVDHASCHEDEWLSRPCLHPDGSSVDRPIVWSRRNGPWRRVEIVWVGAAPGNAGGKGSGDLGAHGTRIPFGGDISGANVDVFFSSVGTNRNESFIAQAFNQLPATGGGEPTLTELSAPVGDYPSSVHLLRDTLLAAGPRLIVVFGNVALRSATGAFVLDAMTPGKTLRLPTIYRLRKAGLERGTLSAWPGENSDAAFEEAWSEAWGSAPLPKILWVSHPSAQNMSPYAGLETGFHRRMLEALDALRAAARDVLGRDVPRDRPFNPETGIYALPEWTDRIGPRHAELDAIWREKGV